MFKHLRKINGEVQLKVRACVGGKYWKGVGGNRESFKTDLRSKSQKERVRKREDKNRKINFKRNFSSN
jgi:hypothetical protein